MRSYREPEYRRRIRQNAAKKQEKTEKEDRKTTDKNRVEQLAAAIYRVEQSLERGNNEQTPQKNRDRRWEHFGIGGLWVAAAVGVAAIWFGSHESAKQRAVMRGQLTEMQTASQKTDETIAIMKSQAATMQGQLDRMQAVTRPYILFDEFRSPYFPDTEQAYLGVRIENSGNSVPQNLHYGFLCQSNADGKNTPEIDMKLAISVRSVLGPKQSENAGDCLFAGNNMDDINSQRIYWFYIGAATYEWYNITYTTVTCRIIRRVDRGKNTGTITFVGNGCPTHNCIDEECSEKEKADGRTIANALPPKAP